MDSSGKEKIDMHWNSVKTSEKLSEHYLQELGLFLLYLCYLISVEMQRLNPRTLIKEPLTW